MFTGGGWKTGNSKTTRGLLWEKITAFKTQRGIRENWTEPTTWMCSETDSVQDLQLPQPPPPAPQTQQPPHPHSWSPLTSPKWLLPTVCTTSTCGHCCSLLGQQHQGKLYRSMRVDYCDCSAKLLTVSSCVQSIHRVTGTAGRMTNLLWLPIWIWATSCILCPFGAAVVHVLKCWRNMSTRYKTHMNSVQNMNVNVLYCLDSVACPLVEDSSNMRRAQQENYAYNASFCLQPLRLVRSSTHPVS